MLLLLLDYQKTHLIFCICSVTDCQLTYLFWRAAEIGAEIGIKIAKSKTHIFCLFAVHSIDLLIHFFLWSMPHFTVLSHSLPCPTFLPFLRLSNSSFNKPHCSLTPSPLVQSSCLHLSSHHILLPQPIFLYPTSLGIMLSRSAVNKVILSKAGLKAKGKHQKRGILPGQVGFNNFQW